MNYSFFPQLLVRTPLYSYQDYTTTDYSLLLKSDQFQTAIFLSSKAFYDELLKKDFVFDALTEKQKQAVIKYFNRASYRSTPFGTFSSFSLIDWMPEKVQQPITLSDSLTPYIKPDFSVLVSMHEKLMQSKAIEQLRFYTNATLYFTDTDIRYVKTHIDEKDHTLFSMVSLNRNAIVKQLQGFCAGGKTLTELRAFVMEETGATAAAANGFITELYDQEILIPETRPNVVGSYFIDQLLHHFQQTFTLPEEQSLINALMQLMHEPGAELQRQLLTVSAGMARYLTLSPELKSFYYAVAERKTVDGALHANYQQQLLEGLHCLAAFSKEETTDDLKKFKEDFIAKYENREVPLLEVLDPQLGIGYGSFDSIKSTLGLPDNLDTGKAGGSSSAKAAAAPGPLLLREWQTIAHHHNARELVITDAHLAQLAESSGRPKFPPSISVMFRVADGNVFFEHAGSSSALSLIGRFSCSENVAAYAKEIAAAEQRSNDGVIFAEISHICDIHAANINQRDHLREYEIPVLSHSSLPAGNQLPLADLQVSVMDDTVILRSKRLKKIIVPRLASAYNYTKSVFSIFRFFCDLQGQGLRSNLLFSLERIVPGLQYYPRVRYKSCVLQLAEWHFSDADIKHLTEAPPEQQPSLFRDFCRINKIPDRFSYNFFDNYIVYNASCDQDIVSFLKEIKNKPAIVIKEFPYADSQSHVQDEKGRPLLAQYLASLQLQSNVYTGSAYHEFNNARAARLRDTSDWLYFKIYSHTLSSDSILTSHLLPLIEKAVKAGTISEWFWIRYNDPDPHIRLRLLPSKKNYGACFEMISSKLNKLSAIKLIDRFQTEQYKRETERYSVELMREVERIFGYSSAIVGSLLKSKRRYNWDEYRVLSEAVMGIRNVLEGFGYADADKAVFCKEQFGRFFLEFGSPKELKPAAEKIHKVIAPLITKLLSDKRHQQLYKPLSIGIAKLKKSFKEKKVKSIRSEQLVADLIHMHLNRLFLRKQRYFEMVAYFLALRSLSAEAYKQKPGALTL